MDNPISWAILVLVAFAALIFVGLKAIEEQEQKKADGEAAWAELVKETRESDWRDFN